MVGVSNRLNEAVTIIAKHAGGIRAKDLLEELHVEGLGEESRSRAEFSLNYFLKKEKSLVCRGADGEIAWEVRAQRPFPEECSVTVGSGWIERGILVVPLRLARRIGDADALHICSGGADEELPYEKQTGTIRGLGGFYKKKGLDEGDRVHLRASDGNPSRVFIHTRWRRSLSDLLTIEPQELDWESVCLRDCIIVVLAKLKMPLHYREIYGEVAHHKRVSPGSVIGTLSRLSGSVFVHVEHGKWQLVGLAISEPKLGPKPPISEPKISEPGEETWKAIARIEKNDLVYRLLQQAKRPLSFDEICSRLSSYLGIDVDQLRATGFLRGDDERLRRLDDGTWALAEWSSKEEPPVTTGEQQPEDKEGVRNERRRWLWAALLGLILSVVAAIVYVVMKGR